MAEWIAGMRGQAVVYLASGSSILLPAVISTATPLCLALDVARLTKCHAGLVKERVRGASTWGGFVIGCHH